MSTYTQDITHLIGKINTNLPDNDTQAITAARIRDAMGAVAYNYDLYVLKTDLDTAGYVTASQLEGLATEQELQEGMQSVLDDSYAYVVEKISDIPVIDPSLYVSKTELSEMGYVTESSLGDYVTESQLQSTLTAYITQEELSAMGYITSSDLPDMSAYVTESQLQQAGYVTESQLTSMSYATKTYVADYVASHSGPIDLSAYVTKTELSAAGYLTAVPSEYVTESQLQSTLTAYITDTELSSMGYITEAALGDYVTTTSLQSALEPYVTETELSQAGYITETELSNVLSTASYVTQNELSNAGYINTQYLEQASYVSQQALSGMGYLTAVPSEYVTESQLQSTLTAYITETELSAAGYITSSYAETYYLDYTSFGDYTSWVQDTLIDANILITDPETGDWTPQAMASETYVADYVAEHAPSPDLSSYVTKTELSNAGYLTSIPSEYITESELDSMGYVTNTSLQSQLQQAGYITSSDIPAIPVIDENLIPNTTATYTLGDSTHFYDATYANNWNLPNNGGFIKVNNNNRVLITSTSMRPSTNNYYSLGTSTNQWSYTYSAYFIENGTDISEIYATKTQVNAKQDTLVSGTNIKTINNESLLGSGNIDIQAGGTSDYSHVLTFTAEQANSTIKFKREGTSTSLNNAVLQYSTDNGDTWNEYTLDTTITLAAKGDTVKFKGTNNTMSMPYGYSIANYHRFVMTGKIAASGDVTSLLNGLGGDHKLPNYVLVGLFYECTSLTKAPNLPSTTLSNNCYGYMFYGCTSLTTAPELPATTTIANCYYNMFRGCTSLTTAPELPATTVTYYCYASMFSGCTSLATAPSILPATTLAEGCYDAMFYGCSALTKAPILPAKTLVQYCYSSMFRYCTQLNYVKAMFTTTPSNTYTQTWLYNVSATGTFVKSNDATWTDTGTNAVPTGWTVYKTVAIDTDDVPESYVEDEGKTLQVVSGVWTKVTGGGGDTNVIESVSVNGTALTPDANKNVDITVPTNTNELTNGAGFITSSSIPSVTVTNSGSGNAVTSVTASGHTLTVTKGSTFLTSANLIYDSTTNTLTINV